MLVCTLVAIFWQGGLLLIGGWVALAFASKKKEAGL